MRKPKVKREFQGILFQPKGRDIWWARLYWERESSGKKKRASLHTRDMKTAEIRYKELEREYLTGKENKRKKRVKIADIIKEYLDKYSSNPDNVIPKNHRLNKYRLNIILEYFHSQNIKYANQITPAVLEGLKMHLKTVKSPTGDQLSSQTIAHYLARLRAAFNIAIGFGMIDSNPIRISKRNIPGNVKMPTITHHRKPRAFTNKEVEKILKEADNSIKPVIILALNTGLRLQELSNLQWNDIDIRNKLIYIQSKHGQNEAGKKDFTPKSRRLDKIPLNKTALKLLKSLPRDREFVFSECGDLSKRISKLLKRIGLYQPGQAMHAFRHTFITNLSKLVPDPVGMRIARIRDRKTYERYITMDDSGGKKELEKIEFGHDLL